MTYKDDGLLPCKLQRNNAPKLRHYWNTKKNVCDCGCSERVFIRDWICIEKLRDILNESGYSLEKINTGSVEGVHNGK